MAGRGCEMVLCAVGDVTIDRDDPASGFEQALPLLREADVLFGNCEAPYTDRVERAPSAGLPLVVAQRNAAGLGHAGFDVMSCANNHMVDAGHEGMLETMAALRCQGIATCGAGATPEQAHAAAVVERDGMKIAFVAYSCVYPPGYEARHGRPGIATIRTHTVYTASELQDFQSGGAPAQFTIANPRDVDHLREHVSAVREGADVVVVSCHWGDGTQPLVLMDYERDVARAAVDAGADLVLGHHHHMLRGVDFHRGKPIFYGLGHFVFDMPTFGEMVSEDILSKMRERAGEYGYAPRTDYPLLPMHPEARMTAIAVCAFRDGAMVGVGVVPCLINRAGQPVPLAVDSDDGRRVREYLEAANHATGLRARYASSQRRLAGYEMLAVLPA